MFQGVFHLACRSLGRSATKLLKISFRFWPPPIIFFEKPPLSWVTVIVNNVITIFYCLFSADMMSDPIEDFREIVKNLLSKSEEFDGCAADLSTCDFLRLLQRAVLHGDWATQSGVSLKGFN